jgi:hypothetical protein
LPIKLIVADDYLPLISNDEQLKIINSFVTDMEESLHIKHERISFEQVWNSAPPADVDGETLQNYMKDVISPVPTRSRLIAYRHVAIHSFMMTTTASTTLGSNTKRNSRKTLM